MGLGRRVRHLLIAVVMGAGLLSPYVAQAGQGVSHPEARVAAEQSAPPSPSPAPAAVADCHSADTAAVDAPAPGEGGGTCVSGHCVQCAALPASSVPVIGEPPALDRAVASALYRPGRCTAPETPPPIA